MGNHNRRAALISMSLSFLLDWGSMWMVEWEEPGGEESGELGGDGAAGAAGGSKYCIQVRSPDGVADCEWGPLDEVGGGQNGE